MGAITVSAHAHGDYYVYASPFFFRLRLEGSLSHGLNRVCDVMIAILWARRSSWSCHVSETVSRL